MNKSVKFLLVFAFVGIPMGTAYMLNGASTDSSPTKIHKKRQVRVARAERSDYERKVRLLGVVRSVNRVKLSFTVGERMISRPVEVGDHVESGQVLARLDSRKHSNAVEVTEAELRVIEARLNQVRKDRDRYERLVDARASSAVQLEKILESQNVLLASRVSGEVKLREARRVLKDTVLRAPFAGTVTEVLLEPGEFAAPGKPVVVLSGDGDLEIEVEAPESLISSLDLKDSVSVELPMVHRRGLQGTIQYLGRTALGPGRLFPVQIGLKAGSDAVPGMTAEVVFSIRSRPAICVPLGAVINPGGQRPEIFCVRENRAHKVRVDVGSLRGDCVTVRGPIRPDELVVVGGHLKLINGDHVGIVQ